MFLKTILRLRKAQATKLLGRNIRIRISETREIKRLSEDRKEYWFQSTYVPIIGRTGANTQSSGVFLYCVTAEKMKNADCAVN